MVSKKNVSRDLTKKKVTKKKSSALVKAVKRPVHKIEVASAMAKVTDKPGEELDETEAKGQTQLKRTKEKTKYSLLRGMHDVLPREERYWEAFSRWLEI